MTKTPTNVPPIWIEQCAPAMRIRDAFGLDKALDYLVGEKLLTIVFTSEQNPDWPVNLLECAADVHRIFTRAEIQRYLEHLKRTKYRRPWVSDSELRRFEVTRTLLSWGERPARQPGAP